MCCSGCAIVDCLPSPTQIGSHNVLKAVFGAGAAHLFSGMCGQECHASMHCVRMVLKICGAFILQIFFKTFDLFLVMLRRNKND